jgi:hypothetical protein
MQSKDILYSAGGNDLCYTPRYGVTPLLEFLKLFAKKIGRWPVIWCPFDSEDSEFVKVFRDNGHTVVRSHIDDGQDFFEYEPDTWDIIISNPAFCYDKETEVFTKRGWLHFKDVLISDEIFSVNPETQEMEWSKIADLYSNHYKGEMVTFNSKTLDICVTPDHTMYAHNNPQRNLKKSKANKDMLITAKELKGKGNNIQLRSGYKWNGTREDFHIIPPATIAMDHSKDVFFDEIKINMDDWLRFFGLWLADGSVRGSVSGDTRGYAVTITKNDSEEVYVDSVLEKLPFKYHKTRENNPERKHIVHYVIYNKFFHNYMKQFGNSTQKFIPKELKELSLDQIKLLLNSYLNADSHFRGNGIVFGSRSKQLMSDIQELILKSGDVVNFSLQKNMKYNGESYEYYQGFWNRDNITNSKYINKKSIEYDDKIYCAELEKNGVMLVRRNEKVYFSGNTNKRKFFERAISFGKPFALLMTNTWLNDAAPKQLFKDIGLQLLMFDKRIEYLNTGGSGKITFSSSYFCRDFLPESIVIRYLDKQ